MAEDVFIRTGNRAGFLIPAGDADACWPWQGYRNRAGYGHAYSYHLRRSEYAHRVAWSWLNGPAPRRSSGYEVDHLCANRSCVNPSHLALVSIQTNRRRGASPELNRHIRHGLSGYTHRGCRCWRCKRAHNAYQKERRYQQRAARNLLLTAGHISEVLLPSGE